jgi:hypothetical protein
MFLCYTSSAYSQTKIKIGIGANTSSGNANIIGLSSQFSLSREDSTRVWSIHPSFVYTLIKNNNNDWEERQRESYISGSYTQKFGRWKLIGIVEAENSALKKILIRGSSGIGVEYDILRKKQTTIALSNVIMPEIYQSEIPLVKDLFSVRSSTRFKIVWTGPIKIQLVTFFQPAIWSDQELDFLDNIQLRSINSIEFPISKKLSLTCYLNVNTSTFSHYINPKVESTDMNTSILFTYKNF